MKNNLSKISAVFLGVLVLFSSLGFTVSAHLCGGNKVLTAVGFVKKDLSCGMKQSSRNCPNGNHINTLCCQNIFDYHHIEDGAKKNTHKTKTNKLFAFTYSTVITRVKIRTFQISPLFIPPPNRVKNIIFDTQSFLI